MRVGIAHKFIFGFILIILAVVTVDLLVGTMDLPEWSKGVVPTLVAIIVGLTIGFYYSKGLTRHVSNLLAATERMAAGDLRESVVVRRQAMTDEFDDLGFAVNRLHDNLADVVGHIVQAANELAVSTETLSASAQDMMVSGEQISQTMEKVASGVDNQKDSVADMATLIHEQGKRLESIGKACAAAASVSREAKTKSEAGSVVARSTFEDLHGALTQLEGSAKAMVEFSERIHQIHRFTEIITNISRQTNLLALNAAIEATKAGEEGKGFAVVAEEIRRLADSAEKSADQITTMLDQLSNESRNVRSLMEESVKRVGEGRHKLQSAGDVLEEITGLVEKNADQMGSIPSLVEVQVSAAQNVEQLVTRIEEVAESNATAAFEVTATVQHQSAAMEEVAGGAVRISKVAEDLHHRVVRFRLPQGG